MTSVTSGRPAAVSVPAAAGTTATAARRSTVRRMEGPRGARPLHLLLQPRYSGVVMTARAPGKIAIIPLVLALALVVVYLALHAGAVSISGNHGRDAAPAAAPASTQGGATNANEASSGSGADGPSTTARR